MNQRRGMTGGCHTKEGLRKSITRQWARQGAESTEDMIGWLQSRYQPSLVNYCLLRYGPVRFQRWKLWKTIHSDGVLDIDIPFRTLKGQVPHVKLKARVEIRKGKPVVEAKLYTWKGKKPRVIDEWVAPLRWIGGGWKPFAPIAPGIPPAPPPQTPRQLPSPYDPLKTGRTLQTGADAIARAAQQAAIPSPTRAFKYIQNPVSQAARMLQTGVRTMTGQYATGQLMPRWLQRTAAQYGMTSTTNAFQASHHPVNHAARTLQTGTGSARRYSAGQTMPRWLQRTAAQYGMTSTTNAFQASHNPVSQAARMLQTSRGTMARQYTAQQTMPRWLQRTAAQYGMTSATNSFHASHNPVSHAARMLQTHG